MKTTFIRRAFPLFATLTFVVVVCVSYSEYALARTLNRPVGIHFSTTGFALIFGVAFPLSFAAFAAGIYLCHRRNAVVSFALTLMFFALAYWIDPDGWKLTAMGAMAFVLARRMGLSKALAAIAFALLFGGALAEGTILFDEESFKREAASLFPPE
jgi:hypothetical protein